MTFTVYGTPIPQGSTKAFTPKGWKRPVLTSDNARLKSWRQLVAEAAHLALLAQPAAERQLLLDAVTLTIAFALPRPLSLPKRITAHTRKPDIDKLVRAVADAVTGILFRDDAQIVQLTATKCYAPLLSPPFVTITVAPAAGNTFVQKGDVAC